jgi:hypothetical protein
MSKFVNSAALGREIEPGKAYIWRRLIDYVPTRVARWYIFKPKIPIYLNFRVL